MIQCILLSLASIILFVNVNGSKHPEFPLLSGSSFVSKVIDSEEMWVLAVTAPPQQCGEACDQLVSQFAAAQKRAGKIIRFGSMLGTSAIEGAGEDGDDVAYYELLNTTLLPVIAIYPIGSKTMKPITMLGPEATLQFAQNFKDKQKIDRHILRAFFSFLPSNFLLNQLTERNIVNTLKNSLEGKNSKKQIFLLFTAKRTIPVLFQKMSALYHKQGLFGVVQKDMFLCKVFGVTKFPTLIRSPISHAKMFDELEQVVDLWTIAAKEAAKSENKEDRKNFKADSVVSNWIPFSAEKLSYDKIDNFISKALVPLETPQILNDKQFRNVCGKVSVCCVAFLSEPESRSKKLKLTDSTYSEQQILSKVASRNYLVGEPGERDTDPLWDFRDFSVAFTWLIGEEQHDLMSAFKIYDNPSLVCLNLKKKLYASYSDKFEEKKLRAFVAKVTGEKTGSGLSSIKHIPSVEASTERKLPSRKKKRKIKKRKKKKKSPKKDDEL